jgi:hypothetical protein
MAAKQDLLVTRVWDILKPLQHNKTKKITMYIGSNRDNLFL